MADDIKPPKFEPRELKDGSGFYVLVIWPYGPEEHVNGFRSVDEAKIWIDLESKGWLFNHPLTLRD